MTNEAAQLNVLISGGFAGASRGSGPQTIAVKLGRGVAADVVILSRDGLSELFAAKMIAAGTDVDLARVRLDVGGARRD
jgi:hypothetical protein